MVGAGQSPGTGHDRERASFSNYGSRVDVQGWGDSVFTTGWGGDSPCGYRNSDDPADPNFWYTCEFSGTSSASAIVAGAVANLQGVAKSRLGALTPSEVRQLLVETGSPQLGNTAEHIGPRPNLRLAIARLSIPGDFPPADCDVDGSDLAVLIADPGLLTITAFAENFGKNACW